MKLDDLFLQRKEPPVPEPYVQLLIAYGSPVIVNSKSIIIDSTYGFTKPRDRSPVMQLQMTVCNSINIEALAYD
jgi:hypothetical protein